MNGWTEDEIAELFDLPPGKHPVAYVLDMLAESTSRELTDEEHERLEGIGMLMYAATMSRLGLSNEVIEQSFEREVETISFSYEEEKGLSVNIVWADGADDVSVVTHEIPFT